MIQARRHDHTGPLPVAATPVLRAATPGATSLLPPWQLGAPSTASQGRRRGGAAIRGASESGPFKLAPPQRRDQCDLAAIAQLAAPFQVPYAAPPGPGLACACSARASCALRLRVTEAASGRRCAQPVADGKSDGNFNLDLPVPRRMRRRLIIFGVAGFMGFMGASSSTPLGQVGGSRWCMARTLASAVEIDAPWPRAAMIGRSWQHRHAEDRSRSAPRHVGTSR